MRNNKIRFSLYKSRTEIADELKLTTHFMKKKLDHCGITLPKYQLLDVFLQISIYKCLLHEDFLIGTEYEKYF